MKRYLLSLALCCLALLTLMPAHAVDPTAIYPTAIFAFQERGNGVKDYGAKISDILFAELTTNENILLVDRAEMSKVLDEAHVNLSGMVNSNEATQVGQLTGAKVLVTGSVFEANKTLYMTAKIIGTETSRVVGETVKGMTTDDMGKLAEELAKKVADRIIADAGKLVAKPANTADQVAELNTSLGDAKRPTVYVAINEHHVGQQTVDPAAQTEMVLYCKGTNFTVVDDRSCKAQPFVIIQGEGFSEFATRIGNLVSCKARVEVTAIDPATNKVLVVDRQTVVAVDLSEQIAGKTALQQAAAMIAQRMLPKLVQK